MLLMNPILIFCHSKRAITASGDGKDKMTGFRRQIRRQCLGKTNVKYDMKKL